MKKFHWIVVLLSAVFLAGCASGPKALSKNDPNSPSGDLDGDSIVNSMDECADTVANVLVDAKGCEVATGVIEGLDFGPGQASLSSDAQSALDVYIEQTSRNCH